MSMVDIYLVRHGQTDFNQAGLLQGHAPSRLTARGQQQARCAAAYFEECLTHALLAVIYIVV